MPLSVGDKLGSYEILAPIGAGGMGEVYKSRDTKLGREVAVKVLPAALERDPERLARFEREAKVLASLNHPNIAQIYGIEDRAIVMELVDGPTLADRIGSGAIPLEEALKIAAQIAEALEAAHEKGVVHRDLKPANVKVRDDGTVKVLDFGLATAVQSGARESAEGANSPTLTIGATEAGVILGTAAYMSPEQAAGKPVDRRADIWSFGVVLWEMLTAKRLFEGETISHTLADVLRAEIDFAKLSRSTPLPIRELLKRCLDRDLKTRLRDIGEARIAIQKYLANPASAPDVTNTGASRSGLGWRLAVAVLVVIAAVLGIGWWRATRSVEQPLKPLVRLDVDLGTDVSLVSTMNGANVIISTDGTRLAYVSQGRLFTRRLDQPKASELTGTQGATSPFFSPDGQWIGFFGGGKLKKASVEGGAVITLCDASFAFGGSWGEDGNIIAGFTLIGGLWRIPSAGGAPVPFTELDRENGEIVHRWPQVLPGGKAVLFTAHTRSVGGFDGANLEVMSVPDRRKKILLRGGTFGRYVPTGHLIYINQGTLFAVPFDLEKLEVRGTPAPILEDVAYEPTVGSGQFDFSRNGTLAYRSGGQGGLVTVQWLDSAGKTQLLLAKPGFYQRPSLSPDGRRLAVEVLDGSNQDIWVYEWQRDAMTRLTFGGGPNQNPVWSPDGRVVMFQNAVGMAWIRSDGAGKPQQLTKSKGNQWPWSFTSAGTRLAFFEASERNTYNLWTLPLEGDGQGLRAGKPEPFLQSGFDERYPAFSPDGRWLAYASNESGTFQVYVRAFPDTGGKWQISNTGGAYPMWTRNAHELFFETLDNRIMVATYVVKDDSFLADKPRVWSEKRLGNQVGNVRNFDLAPEGKRIAALLAAEGPEAQQAQNHVIFLENFFDELRRRVPVSK
jgi:serine/threonine protein kinase/Tol biopolymer transport system component